MARLNTKKADEAVETEVKQEVEIQQAESAEETKQANEAEMIMKAQAKETPAFVDAILKSFSNYEELYVDAKGGVYTPGTSQSIVGDAVLYKNPYFKN